MHKGLAAMESLSRSQYVIMALLGSANLMPWLSFITAVDYFQHLYTSVNIEYYLPVANDLREIQFMRQVSTTNRDGSNHYSQRGRFWAGQEGVAYDRRANGAGTANDIWSVSETHQHLFHLECNAI